MIVYYYKFIPDNIARTVTKQLTLTSWDQWPRHYIWLWWWCRTTNVSRCATTDSRSRKLRHRRIRMRATDVRPFETPCFLC